MFRRWCERLLLILVSLACSGGERRSDETTVAARQAESAEGRVPRESIAVPEGPCLPSWPARVRLVGVVREEQRLGPPGYGETPARDQKVKILILRLARPIDVCADSTPRDTHPAVPGVREVQLTGKLNPDHLKRMAGSTLHVVGTLQRRVWGSDYTDVLIRVDSIPDLNIRPEPSA